ncbi:MAG: hypothetical protein RMK57_04870 [Bryobacterales bacterium]|nr:hypothetical protein [Bryobacteraceae bacterium]MDW8353845.1 hypothetical protein [Bryobacterales bacterium]
MSRRRVQPPWWTLLLVASAAAGTVHGLLLVSGAGTQTVRPLQMALHLAAAAAYLVAVHLCRKIASDHGEKTRMRLAWGLITASAAIAVLRHVFEWLVLATGWIDAHLATLVSLRQIPIVLSLLLLTAGLAAMWSSFAAVGLGLRFRPSDGLLLGAILALVPAILVLRDSMHDAQSAYPLIRRLQSASPLLLAAPAAMSVVLHRIRQEMGGGRMAASLRCLAAFLVMRLVSLWLGLIPGVAAATILSRTLWWAAPWLFVVAVWHRWQVTVSAAQLAVRYETDPETELAEITRELELRRRGHAAAAQR